VSSTPRPAVPADIADLRVQMMRLETMLTNLARTIEEHFVARKESNEHNEAQRREGADSVSSALHELTAKVEKVDKRVELVERDIGSIKIGWSVLVKAASLGSAMTAALVGAGTWLAWAWGWIHSH
jgi:chromosome segregation ATPase